ncbi:MAG: ABC transporter ATP-binding protein [Chloroflexi bacterium]|nr:ABC transporter ATP-binding protein [Chloroflexota bacterium]
MLNQHVLQTIDVTKEFKMGQVMVHALRGVSLSVNEGEFMGVIGPSGSGKSTLLGLIGGLDTPTSGQVIIDGVDITRMDEVALTRVRNEKIGFVFQFFNLVPTLTALENVELPIQFARNRQFNPTKRAKELLDLFGLKDRMRNRPSQLSGGQQQRVAIARALANNPAIVLADEPTGSLDSESGGVVMQTLRSVQRELGTAVIIVTHDPAIAAQVDRIVSLSDGLVATDHTQEQLVEAYKKTTGELKPVESAEGV